MVDDLGINITTRCDLRCRHCLLGPPDEIQDFPTQLLESLLEEARPFGIRHVALIGGEPGLHPEFDRIVEMVADAGYTWRFPSNGQCRELYESSMRRHRESLHHVTLSIDGADAETHDYIRRKEGAFERVTLTARYYTKMGFPVRVGTTLNRKNREQVEALIRLATDLQAYSINFGGIIPRPWNQELVLSDAESLDLYQQIEEFKQAYEIEVLTASSLYTRGSIDFCDALTSGKCPC